MESEDEIGIVIRGEYITLGQLVKLLGLVNLGSEARYYLSEVEIFVNGEPENRRGRKLRPNDRVSFPDGRIVRMDRPNPG